jgi:REP element-mobilizing transposase RayT
MYYERHLPHWQPEGVALFVTWRLHGSLPGAVIAAYRDQPAGQAFVAIDRELDRAAIGPRWLENELVAGCVVETLRHGAEQLAFYELRAWVVMANHVHILICPQASLSKITKSIKGFSARQANGVLGRTGLPFWQDESYDRWVRGPEELQKIVRYIEANPVAAGLVRNPEDWRWSSAFGQSGWTDLEVCPT